METTTSNKLKYYLHGIFSHIILLLTSGAVVQSFLLEKGLTEESIGIYISAIQIVSVVVMLLYSMVADNIKNIIAPYSYIKFFELPLCAFLLFLWLLGLIV